MVPFLSKSPNGSAEGGKKRDWNWKEEREVLSNEVFGDKGEFDGAKKF